MKIPLSLLLLLIADGFQFVQSVEHNERNFLESVKIVGCPEDELCWPKCCLAQEYLDTEIASCSPTNNSGYLKQPDIFELSINFDGIADLKLLLEKNITMLENYGHRLHSEICKTSLHLVPSSEKVTFLSNGQLYIESMQEWGVSLAHFCIENFVNVASGDHFVSAFICTEDPLVDSKEDWIENVSCRDVLSQEVR